MFVKLGYSELLALRLLGLALLLGDLGLLSHLLAVLGVLFQVEPRPALFVHVALPDAHKLRMRRCQLNYLLARQRAMATAAVQP